MTKLHRLASINLLLASWLNRAKIRITQLNQQHADKTTEPYSCAVKNLLLNEKLAFYKHFISRLEEDPAIVEKAIAVEKQNLEVLLSNANKHLRIAIASQEASLQDAIEKQSFSIALKRFLKNNMYAASARNMYIVGDKYIGEKPLSPAYFNFFSNVLALGLFSIDCFAYSVTGLPYGLITSLVNLLLVDVFADQRFLNLSGDDEIYQVANYKKFVWVVRFAVHVLLSAYNSMSLEETVVSSAGFIVATTSRWLSQTLLAAFPKSFRENSIFRALGGVLGAASVYVGHYAWISLYQNNLRTFLIKPDPEKLLANSDLCMRHREDCRKAALDVLELPETATQVDIRKRWRMLVKENTLTPSAKATSVVKLSQARESLWMLEQAQDAQEASFSHTA